MRIYRYLMEHKVAFCIVVLCFVVQACCELALPQYTSNIVDVGIAQFGIDSESLAPGQTVAQVLEEYEANGVSASDVQMSYLVHTGTIMLVLAGVALLVHCVMNFFCCQNATKIARDLRNRFFARVVSFSDAEIDSFSAASLITRGTNDIQQIQMVCMMAQRMVVYTVVISLGALLMVAKTNINMSWIIGLAVVVVALAIGILFSLTMPQFRKMQKLVDKLNLVSREILNGLPVVRAFGRQNYEDTRFKQANSNLYSTQLFTNRAMACMQPLMMLVMNVVSIAIVWVGGHYVDAGSVQTGDLIAFITYAMIIVMSFLMIGVIAVIFPRANVAAARVDEVINTASSIQDALCVYDNELFTSFGKPAKTSTNTCENTRQGTVSETLNHAQLHWCGPNTPIVSVRFNHVSFRYPSASANVLDDVSFEAPAGKTTALIGSTGSGKSSIIRLIERFYDVCEGSIEMNGIDIRNLSQHTLRSLLGYVPQQAFLFSGTVESNVSFGAPQATHEHCLRALDIAQARSFVEEKPEGLYAPIAQGGTNVSGGQRQRLAIARAVATNAPLFLFDDSFSALDYATDANVRHQLHTQLKNRTIIIVAQRVATIMNADVIVVLDQGRVVGSGTHAELLRECETYREIAQSQLSSEELLQTSKAHVVTEALEAIDAGNLSVVTETFVPTEPPAAKAQAGGAQ